MALLKAFLRLHKPAGDDGSDAGGGTPEDRGDFLPEDDDIDPENPDADKAKADAEAKKLEDELKSKEKAEDADAEDEDDEDDEKKAKKKDTRIPLNRHKEILAKERAAREALEQKVAQYEKGREVAELNTEITKMEDSILTLEKEYTKLLADGELEKASAKMAEIRKTERSMIEAKNDMKIQAAEARATERARYNIALERIESAFPELNPDHDDFDKDLLGEVAELKEAYQGRGLTPTAALQKAVKLLVEPRTSKQEIATSSKPRVGDKDVAAERKKEAVKKTADATGKQPPSLTKIGQDGDKLGGGALDAKAVMKMSQKEFAQLSEADLAAMRGDTL